MLELAAAHGIPAPQNQRLLAALERAVRERTGPERLGAQELLASD
jgi:ketopantoate reductase